MADHWPVLSIRKPPSLSLPKSVILPETLVSAPLWIGQSFTDFYQSLYYISASSSPSPPAVSLADTPSYCEDRPAQTAAHHSLRFRLAVLGR